MKWLSLFFILGFLALISTMGSVTMAEPMPSPRGRPATTKRPPSSDDNGADRR
ncbi:uncharacterized protein LOC129951100 [Eupeodes corollae]|uniref:uncharacterized protein LOC129951100 n=1 Tax=Eupeodes corollae TaxID=290404 RepID=UPI002491B18B|nr:uncharacterized protein LOC129951100 [Eupeodes corollae]